MIKKEEIFLHVWKKFTSPQSQKCSLDKAAHQIFLSANLPQSCHMRCQKSNQAFSFYVTDLWRIFTQPIVIPMCLLFICLYSSNKFHKSLTIWVVKLKQDRSTTCFETIGTTLFGFQNSRRIFLVEKKLRKKVKTILVINTPNVRQKRISVTIVLKLWRQILQTEPKNRIQNKHFQFFNNRN